MHNVCVACVPVMLVYRSLKCQQLSCVSVMCLPSCLVFITSLRKISPVH